MAWIALGLRAGWYGLPGAVGLYLWTDLPRRCVGSLSVWTDVADLRRWIGLPRHVQVMHRYRPRGTARSTQWTCDTFDRTAILAEAKQRLARGELSPNGRLMAERAAHPMFARVYARVAEISERRGGAEHRRKLLAGLRGRVIEVGAGSGANFRHYPASVAEVLAVEPEPYLREQAQHAAKEATVAVSVAHGDADGLPDGEPFDAGVVALVLCTVPDQDAALAELYRVIRPGGELRFYEHVRSHSTWEARLQRLADATLWPRLAGGCHLARDTTAAIERAGFRIEVCERFSYSPAPLLPADPHILGVARRPDVPDDSAVSAAAR